MKKIIKNTILTLLLALMTFYSVPVMAQQSSLGENDTAFLNTSGLGTQASIPEVIAQIIKVLLSLVGVIFVVLIIYAGFMWMTSRGNEEAIGKAKRIMAAAVVGLTIVLAAYLITYFVVDQILEATKGGTGLD